VNGGGAEMMMLEPDNDDDDVSMHRLGTPLPSTIYDAIC